MFMSYFHLTLKNNHQDEKHSIPNIMCKIKCRCSYILQNMQKDIPCLSFTRKGCDDMGLKISNPDKTH